MGKWFTTWDRPEYKEWAKEIKGGYSLIIIRKELERYLCVKAKLLMGERGLPEFKVLKENTFSTQKEAENQIQDWRE